jgi:indole-3-glycerol phosphate synthase
MPQIGFERMISVYEQENIFRALERAATVIGINIF